MAFVNTVVLVQSDFAMSERATTGARAVLGAGSIFAALALPKALERFPDRFVLVAGATLIGAGLTIGAF